MSDETDKPIFFDQQEGSMIVTRSEDDAVFTTEDVLLSLCNSVTTVLSAATMSQVRFSGMVQRISKTCLKPDIAASCCSTAASPAWW